VSVLHCLILYAVLRSLGGTVPVLEVSVACLIASSMSALLPSPGGFGSLDIALVAALVPVGAPATAALATVLAYRLLTAWLPFLPDCVLAVLLHRKVIRVPTRSTRPATQPLPGGFENRGPVYEALGGGVRAVRAPKHGGPAEVGRRQPVRRHSSPTCAFHTTCPSWS
jgi:Lysylphosphatidylglycerol synthase TM region